MSFSVIGKNIIPEKVCYTLWAKERYTLLQIVNILRDEQNVTNPRTGKPITVPGVERNAWLYALEHLDEAKADTVSIYTKANKQFSLEDWSREVISKARRFYSIRKFKQFIEKHPQLVKDANLKSPPILGS